MAFLALIFDVGELSCDAAEAACFEAGALSVTLTDSRDDAVLEPAPGEVRLWPATRIEALFSGETDAASTVTALQAALGLRADRIAARVLADRVWEREWLRDFHARRFGERLWVCPHHESVPDSDGAIVRLDPGLAFGTGSHPSTALCLEWLDAHLAQDSRVIDYGCGSGILAIAAIKLGAHSAACFDIDAQALIATHDNAIANGVLERIVICPSARALPDAVDLVLANILSGPLCALAPRFAALVRSGGRVVLAGLMAHEEAEVTEAYSAWFDMRLFGARDEWVGLVGSRRDDQAPTG